MPVEMRSATPDDFAPMARTFALAFEDDPVKLFLTGGKQLSIDRTTPFFDAFLRIQHPHGHVYTTPGHEAASIWSPPGEWKVGFTKVLRYTPRFLRMYGTRFIPNLTVLSDLEKLHPTEPHYYLEFVGTDPAHQGRGFAGALMEPMLARADAEGVGAYLENSKEQNVGFYRRFGFEVRQEMTHRRHGPRQWLMWRDPR
ncbi:MAG TPA: GNAT family N-acetyltransferase [Ilumatobacteraceae bacterium]|nr:GNAT family N-acetyltransferase [Ilumatobacteraceae bacterium]